MANLADLQIGVGVDTAGLKGDFDKVPDMAKDATDEVESKFEKMAPALAAAAKAAAVGAGAAIIAGAVIGMEREAAGDKLGAALNLSEADTARAGEIAGSVYANNFGESIGEVHGAVDAVVSTLADLDSGDVEGLTEKALAMADVFGLDVNAAVTTAGTMLRNNLVSDADEAFDLITAGMQEMPAAMREEVFPVMDEYGGFFDALGLDGQESMSMIAAASEGGIMAMDKVGDSLKELTIRGTDMSTASVEAYEAAGLSAEDMASKLLAGGDTASGAFDEIVEGLLAIEDPTERANAAIGLFGTPLEDLGTAKIPDFLQSLQGLEGGLGDVEGRTEGLNSAYENASGKIATMKRGVEGFLARIVETPGPVGDASTAIAGIGAAAEPIAPMIAGVGFVFQDQLGKMAGSMGRGVVSAAKWASSTALSAAQAAGRFAASTASMIAAGAKWVAQQAVQGAKAAASMAVTAGKFVAHYAKMAAMAMVNAVKMAASWVVAMGPVGWVIAGIVALVALVIANWDKVKEWTGKIWDWVGGKVSGIWTWIKDTVVGGIATVIRFHRELPGKIMDAIKNLATTVLRFIEKYHPAAIIARKAAELWPGVRDWLQALPGRIIDAIGDLRKKMLDKGKDVVTGLWDGIKSMGSWLASKITSFVTDKIPGPIARALGISSPSTVAADLAQEVPRGMVVGMEAEAGKLQRMSERLAMAALPDLGVPQMPRVGAVGSARANAAGGGGMSFSGDIVLPNVTDRSTADDLLAGLRQAVRAGRG